MTMLFTLDSMFTLVKLSLSLSAGGAGASPVWREEKQFSLPRSKTNSGLGYVTELLKTETQVGHVSSYVLFKSANFN